MNYFIRFMAGKNHKKNITLILEACLFVSIFNIYI